MSHCTSEPRRAQRSTVRPPHPCLPFCIACTLSPPLNLTRRTIAVPAFGGTQSAGLLQNELLVADGAHRSDCEPFRGTCSAHTMATGSNEERGLQFAHTNWAIIIDNGCVDAGHFCKTPATSSLQYQAHPLGTHPGALCEAHIYLIGPPYSTDELHVGTHFPTDTHGHPCLSTNTFLWALVNPLTPPPTTKKKN